METIYGDSPLAANPGKATRWNCVKCQHDNKAADWSCAQCGHEPTTGRRDVHPEGRRYDPAQAGGES